jgi:hypothetical protein
MSFVEGFSSGGSATIVPAAVMTTTHQSRIVWDHDQAHTAWVHLGSLHGFPLLVSWCLLGVAGGRSILGLLSCKPGSSINFLAAIFDWWDFIFDCLSCYCSWDWFAIICYGLIVEYNYHIVIVRTMKDWDKFITPSSCSHQWPSQSNRVVHCGSLGLGLHGVDAGRP